MVSHPELDSDPPIGSDLESRSDKPDITVYKKEPGLVFIASGRLLDFS